MKFLNEKSAPGLSYPPLEKNHLQNDSKAITDDVITLAYPHNIFRCVGLG